MRYYLQIIFLLISFQSWSQAPVLDSARWHASAGMNVLQFLGNNDLVYYSQPGFYVDFLYQDYLGKRDSVNEHSIMEIGIRYSYFRGEFGSKDDFIREPYTRSHLDLVIGVGGRVFTRDCSEGYIMGGVTAGIKMQDSEIEFAPTLYLKGGFNYFSATKKRSHGPYLLFSMQDAFFLNDFSQDDYWVLFSVNACYAFRF